MNLACFCITETKNIATIPIHWGRTSWAWTTSSVHSCLFVNITHQHVPHWPWLSLQAPPWIREAVQADSLPAIPAAFQGVTYPHPRKSKRAGLRPNHAFERATVHRLPHHLSAIVVVCLEYNKGSHECETSPFCMHTPFLACSNSSRNAQNSCRKVQMRDPRRDVSHEKSLPP